MSLINEALKRAQEKGAQEHGRDAASGGSARPRFQGLAEAREERRNPMGRLFPAMIALGVLAVGVAAVIMALGQFRNQEGAPRPEPPTPVPVAVAPINAHETPVARQDPVAVATPAVPVVPGSSPVASVAPVVPPVPPVAPATPVVASVATPVVPSVPAPAVPEAAPVAETLEDLVDAFQVKAVHPSRDCALIGNRVFHTGDLVDRKKGIRIVEITAKSITFENHGGERHTRAVE